MENTCVFCDGECTCHVYAPCAFCESHSQCHNCGQTVCHNNMIREGFMEGHCPDCADKNFG